MTELEHCLHVPVELPGGPREVDVEDVSMLVPRRREIARLVLAEASVVGRDAARLGELQLDPEAAEGQCTAAGIVQDPSADQFPRMG